MPLVNVILLQIQIEYIFSFKLIIVSSSYDIQKWSYNSSKHDMSEYIKPKKTCLKVFILYKFPVQLHLEIVSFGIFWSRNESWYFARSFKKDINISNPVKSQFRQNKLSHVLCPVSQNKKMLTLREVCGGRSHIPMFCILCCFYVIISSFELLC